MTPFVVFGALALAAGLLMVVQRNAVHGALLLVLNFFAIAVLFLTLAAEFLMAAQVIVYAGAIMVLFLFVIMLLGVDRDERLGEPRRLQRWQAAAGILFGVLLLSGLLAALTGREVRERFGVAPEGFG